MILDEFKGQDGMLMMPSPSSSPKLISRVISSSDDAKQFRGGVVVGAGEAAVVGA